MMEATAIHIINNREKISKSNLKYSWQSV